MPQPLINVNPTIDTSLATHPISNNQNRSRQWSDDELAHALRSRFVDKKKVIDSHGQIPLRTFERWCRLFGEANKLEISDLPYLRSLQYLRTFINEWRGHFGKSYLSHVQDQNLVSWIQQRNAINRPPCDQDVCQHAQFFRAASSSVPQAPPSRSWFERFMEAHRTLFEYRSVKFRTSKRNAAEDPVVIRKFYDDLDELVRELGITDETRGQMLAGDETGFADDPNREQRMKFVVCRDKDVNFQADRSVMKHTSVMHICDACGASLPPVTMFKGSKLDITAMPDAPPGSAFQFQTNGYLKLITLLSFCVTSSNIISLLLLVKSSR